MISPPPMISEVVPDAMAGERLDRFVALALDTSRSMARAVIESGGVQIDGVGAPSGKVRLDAGIRVDIDPDALPSDDPPAGDPSVVVPVVYVDDAIIVVDKPAGMVVHPGAGNPDGTMVNGLLAVYPELAGVGEPHRPGLVHRLDAGSSGLLVVARTVAAAADLIGQFADHRATRVYRALVWGHPDASRGVIDAPIGRPARDPLRMAVVADGRWARTEYRTLATYDRPHALALLECRLETGRTHQIRVHLSSINHPIVGDPVYGQRRPELGLERPFLHAAELSIDHPVTGDRVSFVSELPDDLATRLVSLS